MPLLIPKENPRAGKGHPKRILVIGPIGIGNLILIRPTIERLRREFPEASISLAVLKKSFVNLVETYSCLDHIILVDQKHGLSIDGMMKTLSDLKGGHFDLSISTFPSSKLRIFTFCTERPMFSKAPKICCS